ncbi:hypothetical protein ACFLXF_02120 [Chloroflexota bacterium]
MVTRVKDRRVEELAKEHVAQKQCAHYWIIETSYGPVSRGACKWCGEEKEFSNLMPEYSTLTPARDKNPLKLPEMDETKFDEKQRRS